MDEPTPWPAPMREEYRSWFAFWAQFAVLGLLAILGAFVAARGEEPGDYACGLILSLAAIALAFLRLRLQFDARNDRWTSFLLVDDMANLILVIVLMVIVALAGIFI